MNLIEMLLLKKTKKSKEDKITRWLLLENVNSFQETQIYGTVLRLHESVGVVGVACPDESPLLSFISLMAPAFVRGNVTVMIPSEKYPLPALELYQVKIKFQFYFFLKITSCDIFSSILTCFLMQQHIILISWASIKHQPQNFTHN